MRIALDVYSTGNGCLPMTRRLAPTNTCPVCGGKSVTFNKYIISRKYLQKLFRCTDCDAELNAKPTWQVLWVAPVCLVAGVIGFWLIDLVDQYLNANTLANDIPLTALVIVFGSAILIGVCALSIKIFFLGSRFIDDNHHF